MDTAALPPIASSIELCFSLPSVPGAEKEMYVQFTGQTVRLEETEQEDHSSGFAIRGREIVWNFDGGKKWLLSAEEEEEE